jgi:hypothetical protein
VILVEGHARGIEGIGAREYDGSEVERFVRRFGRPIPAKRLSPDGGQTFVQVFGQNIFRLVTKERSDDGSESLEEVVCDFLGPFLLRCGRIAIVDRGICRTSPSGGETLFVCDRVKCVFS